MACVYKAKNGNRSKMFDQIYQTHGKAVAVSNFAYVRSEEFLDWFGNGKVDENGDPVITDMNYTNVRGDLRPLRRLANESLTTDELNQINELTALFDNAGIATTVEFDETMQEHGYVIGVNETARIVYNPKKAKRDSIYHEFGHVYVDAIGLNDPLVQQGIRQLEGTELWNQIARNYPELDRDQLSKEVLTTAIGLEARKLYDQREIIFPNDSWLTKAFKNIKLWFMQMIRKFAEIMGVEVNIAKRLAYDLTGSKLRSRINGKISPYRQYSRSSTDTVNRIKTELLPLSEKLKLTDDQKHYIFIDNPTDKMDRTTNALEKLTGSFNREEAIRAAALSDKPEYRQFKTETEVAESWADKRESGSGIHLIAETYVRGRNEGRARNVLKEEILNNLYKPENAGLLDDEGIRIFSGLKRNFAENYVDEIFDFIEDLYLEGYTLFPEVKIGNGELGVAGTIDLLGIDSNGDVHIFDFKTKEYTEIDGKKHSKFDEWNSYSQTGEGSYNFEGLLKDEKNTTANRYALQLSTYKLILSKMGYNVKSMNIVPLIGKLKKSEGEYHYESLELYTGSNAASFKNGMFELKDFTEKLEISFMVKDDVEAEIALKAVAEREIIDNKEIAEETKRIKDFINNVLVDIHRQIKTVQTAARTPQQRRAAVEHLSRLKDKLLLTDEFEALNNYLEYMQDRLIKIRTVYTEKFGTWQWHQFKELMLPTLPENPTQADKDEANKKVGDYYSFLLFHESAHSLLKQFMEIKTLPTTTYATGMDEDMQRISQLLNMTARVQALNGDINDLKLKLDRVDGELQVQYADLSSDEKFLGKTADEIKKIIMEPFKDESFMQNYFDSLADTNVTIFATMRKMIDHQLFNKKQNVKTLLAEYVETKDKYGIKDSKKFVDERGRLLEETDWDAYHESRNQMWIEFHKMPDDKNRAIHISDWTAANEVDKTDEEIAEMERQKRSEMTEQDFQDWKADQFVYSEYYQRDVRRAGYAYKKPNPTIYTSKAFAALTENEKKFLFYLKDLFGKLTSHLKSTIIQQGYIPAIPINTDPATATFLKGIGWKQVEEREEQNATADGSIIRYLPFQFNRKLAYAKIEKEVIGESEEAKRQRLARNAEARKQAELAHGAKINKDLDVVIPMFIESSLTHKYKTEIELEIKRFTRHITEHGKMLQVSMDGVPFVDAIKNMSLGGRPKLEKHIKDSRILNHWQMYLEMVFYGEFEAKEKIAKLARVIQNYTSLVGMALNVTSGINNQVYGTLMAKIEAAGGEEFSKKDWNWGRNEYVRGMVAYFTDRNKDTGFTNKPSAFVHAFDIMMDFKETAYNANVNPSNASRGLRAAAKVANSLYIIEHLSEHNIQNHTLFAMAHSHRVVDGKIIAYREFKRGRLEQVDAWGDKEAAKAAIERNKEIEKGLKEEWEKFTRYYDYIQFDKEKGKINLGQDTLARNAVAEFEAKVLGMNQYLHGIYNREDAGVIQHYALGRLVIQFKKWMRPGWNKRWGSRTGEKFYNERRRNYDEGYYMNFINFMGRPILRRKELKEMTEEQRQAEIERGAAAQAMTNIFEDYIKFFGNIRIHWHSLTDAERAGVTKTLAEYGRLIILFGMYALAQMLWLGDDDEEDASYPLMLALYQMDRAVVELTTYVPVAVVPGIPGVYGGWAGGGWLNELNKTLKSPAPSKNSIERLWKLGTEIVAYPFKSEEDRIYQTGIYYGQSKAKVHFLKSMPVASQVYKMANISRNYKYYKLF